MNTDIALNRNVNMMRIIAARQKLDTMREDTKLWATADHLLKRALAFNNQCKFEMSAYMLNQVYQILFSKENKA